MNGRVAKRLRREAKERGEFKSKQLFAPLTVNIKGEEVYIPRRERRRMTRQLMTGIRKGRIDPMQLFYGKEPA